MQPPIPSHTPLAPFAGAQNVPASLKSTAQHPGEHKYVTEH
jgi:hypothetical protein